MLDLRGDLLLCARGLYRRLLNQGSRKGREDRSRIVFSREVDETQSFPFPLSFSVQIFCCAVIIPLSRTLQLTRESTEPSSPCEISPSPHSLHLFTQLSLRMAPSYDPDFFLITSMAYIAAGPAQYSEYDLHIDRLHQAHLTLARLEPDSWCAHNEPMDGDLIRQQLRKKFMDLEVNSRVSQPEISLVSAGQEARS